MAYRVAIVGASSLRGEELGSILRYRRFPSTGVRLLDEEPNPSEASGEEARRLAEFADEPALIDRITPEQFQDVDVTFFAGDPHLTKKYWREALSRGSLVVDLSSALEDERDAEVIGPAIETEIAGRHVPRVVVIAHPAAQVLVRLLHSISRVAEIDLSAATIFEPASERGRRGVDELKQQTVNLFSFKPLPTEIYDSQIAFNLRVALGDASEPALKTVSDRIRAEVKRLAQRSQSPPLFALPAIQLIQAPVFHAVVLSLFVRLVRDIEVSTVEQALGTADVKRLGTGDEADVLQAAGEDQFQLGALRPDPSVPRGYWLFSTLDNLRISALAAVDAATTLLQLRSVA